MTPRAEAYSEVGAAISILIPSVISAMFLRQTETSVRAAALGCIAHCPFSVSLHLYKAFGMNPVLRTRLYKLDALFIHIHIMSSMYAWRNRIRLMEFVYHGFSMAHIVWCDPLNNVSAKTIVDVLAGIGVMYTISPLFVLHFMRWVACVSLYTILVTIHNRKLLGIHSSWVMHLMLSGPQYLVLQTMRM